MTYNTDISFFNATLSSSDTKLYDALTQELDRQKNQIELIASENIVSKAVLEAGGSVLTNKYAEGYPGKRYYGGCSAVDIVETLAIERAKILFNADYVNVQPHAGAQANEAVFLALLSPGDTILGMSLDAGGHLTHGAAPNISGKWFNASQYGVNKQDYLINYDQVYDLAKKNRPKLIIAGGSAYPRIINFNKFRQIADEVNAYLMVDMAHFSGLVASGHYPNPVLIADVVTTTTHKTLRGPRGGMILSNNSNLFKKLNSSIFPGLQGGPLMHIIAAKAAAFEEASNENFKKYSEQVINNAKVLSQTLIKGGMDIITGGTDTHLVLVDLRPMNLKGNLVEESLERAGITCNKNGIPFDEEKPMVTSGIRLGTPAGTTRGFGEEEFSYIGELISEVCESLSKNNKHHSEVEQSVLIKSKDLCNKFPIYNY